METLTKKMLSSAIGIRGALISSSSMWTGGGEME